MAVVTIRIGPYGPYKSSLGRGIECDKTPTLPQDVLRLADIGALLVPPAVTATLGASDAVPASSLTARVSGDGGPVDLTSNPQVAAGTYDGQQLWVVGGHATNTVQLDDGDCLLLAGGASAVLGEGSALLLMWDAPNSRWIELTRTIS